MDSALDYFLGERQKSQGEDSVSLAFVWSGSMSGPFLSISTTAGNLKRNFRTSIFPSRRCSCERDSIRWFAKRLAGKHGFAVTSHPSGASGYFGNRVPSRRPPAAGKKTLWFLIRLIPGSTGDRSYLSFHASTASGNSLSPARDWRHVR
jgi:hypothetical protein